MSGRDPDCSVWFEHTLATGEPSRVKFVVFLQPFGFIPLAFVDLGAFPVLARLATIAEKVRRISPDDINRALSHRREKLEAITFDEFVIGCRRK